MVVIRLMELTDEIISDLEGLVKEHIDELDLGVPFNVDWDVIQSLLDADALITFIAYDKGVVVGYCSYLISPVLFSMGINQATQHAFFVRKDRRGLSAAKHLLQFSEEQLPTWADYICQSVTKANSAGKLMERCGYTLSEEIYIKRI